MPGREEQTLPTAAELTLLEILWTRGPLSVREVHTALGRDVAYTSVLKQLQNMHAKRLVKRRDDARAHIYEAAQQRATVERRAVTELAGRMFGGSAEALAMRALSLRPASSAEMRRIRKMLGADGEETP